MTPPREGSENLDFERADFGGISPAGSCGACGRDLRITCFEVNGVTVCPSCRTQVAEFESPGGGAGRFARAALFGILGGAAGAVVWYAVAAVFSLEIVGILIIGFAVYQAWKMNARRVFEVKGPFRVTVGTNTRDAPSPPPAPPAG